MVGSRGMNSWIGGGRSLAVGQQYDLEHDLRVIGARADFVVVEPAVTGQEVQRLTWASADGQLEQVDSSVVGKKLNVSAEICAM